MSSKPEVVGRERGAAQLIARYDVILLDAYGVLVTGSGPLPAARGLLDTIAEQGREMFVVTNDASRLPETIADRLRGFDLPVRADQVITSGSLLAGYFAAHDLRGGRAMVLGPADSVSYVRAAGGQVVPVTADGACDVLVVCDESGYPFLPTVDDALSMLYRHFDRGDEVALVLPNPDLIYPKRDGAYGYTSGGAALLLEAGLARRYPARDVRFERLGKPHRPMFDEARRRAGSGRMLMIGDQLETDIAGALGAGIDAALVTTGVSKGDEADASITPTYLLSL